jgi:hypothetical protein
VIEMPNESLTAGGAGSASDATFSTAELDAMLAASRDRDTAEEPARRIAACKAKIAKCEEFLAAAKQALADELAAQAKGN